MGYSRAFGKRIARTALRHDSTLPPARAAFAALVCALAIVYVSLIPFNFRPIALDTAWQAFREVAFLRLSMFNRADWIANLVAYVPFGLFVAAATRGPGRVSVVASMVAAVVLGAALAFGAEFAQLYFPGRTVSLNDIAAAILGAAVGGGLWLVLARPIDLWAEDWQAGGSRQALAFLGAYAVLYALASFFPYDFVISLDELDAKLAAGRHALLVVPGGCDALLRCALKPLVEVAAVVPLGWLLARWHAPQRAAQGLVTAFGVGLVIGAAIEIGQLFVVSGTSQGLSVLTRGIGIAAGFGLQGVAIRQALPTLLRWGRVATLLGLPVYLAVIAVVSGWPATPLSLDEVARRWPEFHWLPFYYHYYVPEAHAMASVLGHAALYTPVGVAAALWFPASKRAPVIAAIAAALMALVAELSKAFIAAKHPDITDVLIGAAGAWLAARVFRILTTPQQTDARLARAAAAPSGDARGAILAAHVHGRSYGAVFVALILGVIALWSLIGWPVLKWPLAAGLVLYAVALARWPGAWMIVVPACLPVLDLAPQTGRLYWDELDLVLLVTIAMRLAIDPKSAAPTIESAAGGPKLPRYALALLFCSALVSAAIGLYPLQPLDANAFGGYLSHYNGLRALKAIGWGFALLALMTWDFAERRDVLPRLALGMAIGGALAALGVAWERWLFPGLLDFGADFRVAGTFSAMHVGGAYVEGFLVAAFPFVALQALEAQSTARRALWLAALVLVCYAVLVTYSRGGIAALLAAAVVLTVAVAVAARKARGETRMRSLAGAALAPLVIALVAAPVVAGRYLGDRVSQSAPDLAVRISHWRGALELMDAGVGTTLFGMGLGRFPEAYFWSGASKAMSGSYRVEREKGGNLFLRLGGGHGLFFDQRVDVAPMQKYTLMVRVRSARPDAPLSVALCEKSLLYSAGCEWGSVRAAPQWAPRVVTFETGKIADRRGFGARPVHLTLHNGSPGVVIDVDDVSLQGPDGRELVRNGDFAAGGDLWFFTSDDHLAWHVKNLPLHVFFEQGAVGLAAFALLLWAALGRELATARSEPLAAALLASLAGFMAVGLFDSLIDAPRHLLLFLMLLFMPHFLRRR